MAIDAGYGDTHSGKTKALEMLAGYLNEQNGKGAQVFIGDGGAETLNSRGLVDDGVIRVVDFSVYPYPETVLKLIAQGWWPDDKDRIVKDGKPTGWYTPKAKLTKPSATIFDTIG